MVKQPVRVFLLCICVVLLSSRPDAKEKIIFTPKEAGQHPAKPASCEIQVFQDAKPTQAYVDLGTINFHDERHRSKAGSLKLDLALPKIKANACKVGGDALIDIKVTEVRRLEFAMFNVRATVVRFASP
jgi:hypothetical protein